jgi:acylphosphatase
MLTKDGREKGEDTSFIDGYVDTDPDTLIKAVLQSRGKDGIASFEKAMKNEKGAGNMEFTNSRFESIQWWCRRIGHPLKAVK